MYIDSHVNLHSEAYQSDLDDVLLRARGAGVGVMLTICDRLDRLDEVIAVAARDAKIWASVGVHPHHAKDYADLDAAKLIRLAEHPKVAAIGEAGLDDHYRYSDLEVQQRVLRAHVDAARQLDLPLVIHTREADALMAGLLEEEYARGPFRLLMHCYTSGKELARRAAALGAYFSFSGILTFKNATDVREIALDLPLDRIILETDCPYLAPIPHRGRRNEPAFVSDIYRSFAQLRGLDEQTCATRIAENFHAIFRTIPA